MWRSDAFNAPSSDPFAIANRNGHVGFAFALILPPMLTALGYTPPHTSTRNNLGTFRHVLALEPEGVPSPKVNNEYPNSADSRCKTTLLGLGLYQTMQEHRPTTPETHKHDLSQALMHCLNPGLILSPPSSRERSRGLGGV